MKYRKHTRQFVIFYYSVSCKSDHNLTYLTPLLILSIKFLQYADHDVKQQCLCFIHKWFNVYMRRFKSVTNFPKQTIHWSVWNGFKQNGKQSKCYVAYKACRIDWNSNRYISILNIYQFINISYNVYGIHMAHCIQFV